MDFCYLDNAATTPLDARVRDAMLKVLEEDFGNPSSRHPLGTRAREAVDEARRRVASVVGARPENVVFCSGGTEANNLGVLGSQTAPGKVLMGATEHACVRAACSELETQGAKVVPLPIQTTGAFDFTAFEEALDASTTLVSVMLVNNELGSLYPIQRIARAVRRAAPKAHLHVDAVQALGKVDVCLDELECDSLAISAHKVHGPKGVGALVLGERARIAPRIIGGGQEGGLRSGTENVAGIVGLGLAAELALDELERAQAHCARASEILQGSIAAIPGARVLAQDAPKVDATLSIFIPGVPAEVRMHHLEEHGVYVSAGSACQAATKNVSPTLLALGLSAEEARCVLRFSTALSVSLQQVEHAGRALVEVSRKLEALAS